MTQIFIVDDHPTIRETVRSMLEREKDLAVCGEAPTAKTALEMIVRDVPDLVLIDVSLPDMSGIELAKALRERHPELPLAMFSGHNEKRHVDQALEAGARGYVLKDDADDLPMAIRRMMRGEQYLSDEISR